MIKPLIYNIPLEAFCRDTNRATIGSAGSALLFGSAIFAILVTYIAVHEKLGWRVLSMAGFKNPEKLSKIFGIALFVCAGCAQVLLMIYGQKIFGPKCGF